MTYKKFPINRCCKCKTSDRENNKYSINENNFTLGGYMEQIVFESELMPNGYLYCPKEYAYKNLRFKVTVIPDNSKLSDNIEQPVKKRRKFGSAKGLIKIYDDFNEPLDDFKEYMKIFQ